MKSLGEVRYSRRMACHRLERVGMRTELNMLTLQMNMGHCVSYVLIKSLKFIGEPSLVDVKYNLRSRSN